MRYDLVFLYNGALTPAMLEMASFAAKSGKRPLLITFDRGQTHLVVDSALLNFDIQKIEVGYNSVSARRALWVPKQVWIVSRLLKRKLAPGGTIITASFDMLLVARLASLFSDYRIRHQVRDLHELQLRSGIVPAVVQLLDRYLMRGVSKLIISSPKYYSEYYKEFYSGQTVILENMPQQTVWQGFQRNRRPGQAFLIGYIGVLRYKESLFALIDAVERLARDGLSFRVKFAGGGSADDIAEVKARVQMPHLFEFSGPYEYTKDIKELYSDLDLIFAVYDESIHNCRLAMSNKYYESILSGVPLLTADNTYVGERTRSEGLGTTVSLSDPNSLYAVLLAATKAGSWYHQALESLAQRSPNCLFEEYDAALAQSVL